MGAKLSKPVFTQQLHSKNALARKHNKDAVALAAAKSSPPPLNDLVPDLKVEKLSIVHLKPAKKRVRKTTAAQLQRVIASIKAHGIVLPVLIDGENHIVHGHAIVEAAKHLGIDKLHCMRITHLPEAKLRSMAIALNRVGETGEWDIDELRLELIDLGALDFSLPQIDFGALGFDSNELDAILADPVSGDEEENDIPEAGPPVSVPGDLYDLGGHRLLCGDSLDPDSYELLLEGRKIDCVFSDPPYNCKIKGFVSGLGKKVHEDFAMAVGEMEDAEFLDFLSEYLRQCAKHLSPGAVVFACMDWRQIRWLHIAGELADLHLINMAVWNKGSGGMGSLYRSAYELISIFCNTPSPAINNVQLGKHGRDRSNMWTYSGANRKGSSVADALSDHPTPKPIDLVADALLDVTKKGALVFDPFMGSGTTLIAAERSGRIAYGIELEPNYVDVAIRRWEKMTGKKAIHVETGLSFSQLTQERL